jgi:hypothetical protein
MSDLDCILGSLLKKDKEFFLLRYERPPEQRGSSFAGNIWAPEIISF